MGIPALRRLRFSKVVRARTPAQRLRLAKAAAKEDEFRAWAKSHRLPSGLVAEFRFDPVRKWRLDFAWPDRLVAVEIHGAVHRGGRHVRGTGFLNDREKMNTALAMGWRVVEVGTPGKHPATLYSPEMLDWLQAIL